MNGSASSAETNGCAASGSAASAGRARPPIDGDASHLRRAPLGPARRARPRRDRAGRRRAIASCRAGPRPRSSSCGATTQRPSVGRSPLAGESLELVGLDPAPLGDHPVDRPVRVGLGWRAAPGPRRAPRHRRRSHLVRPRGARTDHRGRAAGASAGADRTEPVAPGSIDRPPSTRMRTACSPEPT